MLNCVVLIALGFLAAPQTAEKWLSDYGVALRQAKLEGLPLLVVLEDPANAQARVLPAKLVDNADSDLLRHYKLCRIDVATPYGKSVAAAFKVSSFPHTSIIDNTGAVQIFRKSGPFSSAEWSATLSRYQNGQRPVQPVAIQSFSWPTTAACLT